MNKSESKYYNTALLMDEALLLLLEKKEFEYITVKEICQKAGVNRSTFYLHYETIEDLLVEAIEMINKRFYSAFNNKKYDAIRASKQDSFFITNEYLIPYLNFIKENKRVFKLIHDKPELFQTEKTLEVMYKEIFSKILDKFHVKETEKIYIFTFYTQGVLSIILKWVSLDCKDEMNDIAQLIVKIINYKNEWFGLTPNLFICYFIC